jgi:cytochrome P450 family 6
MWLQVLLFILCVYFWFLHKFSYWKKRGFLYAPGKFPLGSGPGIGITEHASYFVKREYEKFKNRAPAFGAYLMAWPILVPMDPELIKDILVRSFDSFQARGFTVSEEADPLSQHLLFSNGEEWKDLRAKLSPTFTSGKMKMMFPNVLSKADRMVQFLTPFAERAEPLEMKEIYSSFSTEVIADVAFGLNTDCLGNEENDFRKMGEIVFKPTILENLKLFFLISFAELATMLNLGYTNPKVIEFFMRTVRETLNHRRKNSVVRNDFFQLLMNIEEKEGMSFNGIAANSFVFFLAG